VLRTEFQRQPLRDREFRCGERRFNYFRGRQIALFSSIGFSADGQYADVQVPSGVENGRDIMLYSGDICWLRKEDKGWRQIGCRTDWEF